MFVTDKAGISECPGLCVCTHTHAFSPLSLYSPNNHCFIEKFYESTARVRVFSLFNLFMVRAFTDLHYNFIAHQVKCPTSDPRLLVLLWLRVELAYFNSFFFFKKRKGFFDLYHNSISLIKTYFWQDHTQQLHTIHLSPHVHHSGQFWPIILEEGNKIGQVGK